ncbi:MAG: bifunctional metallophosphatase/5'-nucleotidase [Acholeplasmatales bacterium]|nr:bifunctional metallophosphatase/5'-nucleotidase [Acholeplasmatales bacterium]
MKKILAVLLSVLALTSCSSVNNPTSTTITTPQTTATTPGISTITKSIPVGEDNRKLVLDKNNPYSSNELVEYDDCYIKYKDVDSIGNSHAKINRGGFITNATTLNDIDSFTITYKIVEEENVELKPEIGFGSLYYVCDDYPIDNPFSYQRIDLNSNDREVKITLDGDPSFVSFYTFNTIIIDKIELEYNVKTAKTLSDDFSLKIIGTNDIHGRVNSDGSYASLAYATDYIDTLKKDNKYNILLDQGDLYQGSLDQYATNGKIMEDYLLVNGYDSTIIGNHEWDNGDTKIIEHTKHSKVDILANNIRKNGSAATFTKPYKVIERHGVKIGLIGAMGDCESSISASSIEGYSFLVKQALTAEIKKNSEELKDLGCEFIILQIHDGAESAQSGSSSLEYYDVNSLSGSYVDLVLEGHTHKQYSFKDSKGVYHVQNAGYLGSIYNININVRKTDNGHSFSVLSPAFVRDSAIVSRYTENNVMGVINNWYHQNVYGPLGDRVAMTNSRGYSSNDLVNMVAQIYYNLGKEDGYDVVYGGGYLSCRAPYRLPSGVVVYSDVASLFPFDNRIYLCKISGKNLKRNFINSTNTNYHGYMENPNMTIFDFETYYMVTDSYNTDFWNYRDTDTYAVEIVKSYSIGDIYARDYLFEYLKSLNS